MELLLSTEDIIRPSSNTKSLLVDSSIMAKLMLRLKSADSTIMNQFMNSTSVAMHVVSALPVRSSFMTVSLLDRAAKIKTLESVLQKYSRVISLNAWFTSLVSAICIHC